jgi:hypothetical protein
MTTLTICLKVVKKLMAGISIYGNNKCLQSLSYRCLDKLILGKEIQSETNKDTLEKYDANNRKAVMLIKLSIMDEMLLEVQTRDNAFPIWQTL